MAATSSKSMAMSSIKANKLDPAIFRFPKNLKIYVINLGDL